MNDMKIRQDAWNEEDDLLLAETVLRHVREGSTQLNAFEEVGDKLNRTSAACGFRWNAVVRHNYEKALQLAKKQRKQRQRMLGKEQGGKKKLLYNPSTPTTAMEVGLMTEPTELINLNFIEEDTTEVDSRQEFSVPTSYTLKKPTHTYSSNSLNLDTVITYLQSLQSNQLVTEVLKSENERLKLEIKDLKQRNQEMENKLASLEQNSETIQEDYETLMKIMNRARKLVLLEEDERPATKFKMDRNGNLEKLAE